MLHVALSNARKAISTTPVALNVSETSGQRLYLFNLGPNVVYLGGSGVNDTTGVPVAGTGSVLLTLDQGDILYAVCKTAESATIGILSL